MPTIVNIETANNAGFLWPSIADAVDTFLRRRHNNADAYERVWRLIHLWEATEITLSLASMSRLSGETGTLATLRRQREFFYGKTWDQVIGSFKSMQGAVDGAIDQWINILQEVARITDPPGRFLPALKNLLGAPAIDMGPFVSAWAKACDVPPDYRRAAQADVTTAMRYVNSFRNRLAHVPFPHDPLGEVADALEAATDQLFSIAPLPTAHEKGGESSPLTGAFRAGRCFLHGGQMELLSEETSDAIQFQFPCRRKGEDNEVWQGNPLLHVDTMVRPHVLTRLKSHDVWEYTRFRAEANAVLVKVNSGVTRILPEPAKAEYVSTEETEDEVTSQVIPNDHAVSLPTKGGIESMSDAIEAIRSEDYDGAISFFENQTRERPIYHIGWLRLGYSRREKAVRLAPDDADEAIRLLKLSLEDLRKAAQHKDPAYQAQAWYERSKSSYHLARLESSDDSHKKACVDDAERAVSLSDEKKYFTWWEHIEAWPPGSLVAS